MSDRIDATRLLTEDHRTVEELFTRYEHETTPAEQTKIVHEVIHELAVHGEIEELLFYPRLRSELSDGDALAEEAVNEHLAIKQTLNDLDSMTADDEGFDAQVRTLIDEVRHHVEEEERELFPRVQEAMSKDDLLDLGVALRGAKNMVPTRPHPSAPTGPVAKLAAAPPAVLVDRVRDAVRSFRDERR